MPRPSGDFQEQIRHYTSVPFQNLFTYEKKKQTQKNNLTLTGCAMTEGKHILHAVLCASTKVLTRSVKQSRAS